VIEVNDMQTESKWTNSRILREQHEKLSKLVKTEAAHRLGINSIADALKTAISDVCTRIEKEIEMGKIPFLGDRAPIG